MAADVNDLRIGKGVVSFRETGAGSFTDLGFVSSFTYEPNVERVPYFSAREGIRKKVAEFITEVGATLNLSVDSINGYNLALFTLSDEEVSGSDIILRGLSETNKTGTIRIVGTNDQGRLVDFEADVKCIPSGEFELLTQEDDISSIDLEMEVVEDANGDFGVWTVRPQDGATA